MYKDQLEDILRYWPRVNLSDIVRGLLDKALEQVREQAAAAVSAKETSNAKVDQ